VVSWVIGWPEIPDYIGGRMEMEECTSVPIGLLWDRMILLGSHMTTEPSKRRQEQEF
jgi:hypothetical protein